MKQGDEPPEGVVEVDRRVLPRVVHGQALRHVVDHHRVDAVAVVVLASEEEALEEEHPHDGEDEPEEHADEQDIGDGRDGLRDRVDHDLRRKQTNVRQGL